MGRLILPHHLQPQPASIAKLEIDVRHAGRHLPDLQVGNLMYEGKRCYGVSFTHGGKKWELTMALTPSEHVKKADRDPRAWERIIEQSKRHLLETVLSDIEKRFGP